MLTPAQAQRFAEELRDAAECGPMPRPPAPLPERIGGYRILRVIGWGGMGTVYEAQQERPHRIVAIKVLSPALIPPDRMNAALRRFEYEAELLGALQHPGIAQVFEAGTHDDGHGAVPFIVMEYIPEARAITRYADDEKLDVRQRLEIFATVCDAVHYAHQKGVIHRDLKPANILVGQEGIEAPRHQGIEPRGNISEVRILDASMPRSLAACPKVIDFGIARATNSDVTLTMAQGDVRELLGTLQYMSPEQASGGADLDMRSDVYSLGVILYELLCGKVPYDLSHTPIPHATRIIQERDPPPPSAIRKSLRGDLEAVVLKALEKDRQRRYQSAAELAADLRHYLKGEPVEARRPSRWMRAVTWVGRHPRIGTAATSSAIAAAIFAGTAIGVWWNSFRPHHIEFRANGREAALVAAGGREIQTWLSQVDNGISFGEYIDGRAVLGFRYDAGTDNAGALCAFSHRGELLWRRRIEREMVPEGVVQSEQEMSGFGVHWAKVADVFPARPGLEIIASFHLISHSQNAIRVYDLDGVLLYQIWHDGVFADTYWMASHGLLILSGRNSEVFWPARGCAGNLEGRHPLVVVAARPQVGWIGSGWSFPSPSGDMSTIDWYKCLLPCTSSEVFAGWVPRQPLPSQPPDTVRLVCYLRADVQAEACWLVDSSGSLVSGGFTSNDSFKYIKEKPDVAGFYLDGLPPVIDRTKNERSSEE